MIFDFRVANPPNKIVRDELSVSVHDFLDVGRFTFLRMASTA